jgi:nitrogen fixation/metabolism regulation signal transduction histidine kinase
MDSSRYRFGSLSRLAALTATTMMLMGCAFYTHWYATVALLCGALLAQLILLQRYIERPAKEVSSFLDAIAFDDSAVTFTNLPRCPPFSNLGAAMTAVLEKLRIGRVDREEQAQYLQSIIAHIPVALLSIDERGSVQLMNLAAKRLFSSACTEIGQLSEYGENFAVDVETLQPGDAKIVRMERPPGTLQMKAAATGLVLRGLRHRLISLQNIETELSAGELAAWQAVIRVMAHEVMNSLTPISSLAGTSSDIVADVLEELPAEQFPHARLIQIQNALDTIARRSEGLQQFVHNHRRITKHLVAIPESVRLTRTFARLRRLLEADFLTQNVELLSRVEPEGLELVVDSELLDQALINLLRNSIEAMVDVDNRQITLSAVLEETGHIAISVVDNGPGIPADQRDRVFVPFFTTKQLGSGVGLTLVRQIATLHGATVSITNPPNGGNAVSIQF